MNSWQIHEYGLGNLNKGRLEVMKKTAIVILNWNGKDMLEDYLENVVSYSAADAEVIVADNASTDDSVEYLQHHFPEVRLIRLDQNWGFAEGYNRALQEVKAEYYVLMNSDVKVSEGWLTPLIDFMDTHDDVAACQPKLMSMSSPQMFEYAGACGGFIDKYGYPFCRGRVFEQLETDQGQYDEPVEIHWATGACMVVRSVDYWKAGGFDHRFFAHNEEIDLCWRMRLLGRSIYCLPQSKVFHVGGATLSKSNPMKTYLNFRNNLTMLYKNLPARELSPVMRMRWFLDYLAAFQTLLMNGKWGDCKAIFRARHDFKRWKRDFDKDRELVDTSHTASLRKPYSILWQYYVCRRSRYSDLP